MLEPIESAPWKQLPRAKTLKLPLRLLWQAAEKNGSECFETLNMNGKSFFKSYPFVPSINSRHALSHVEGLREGYQQPARLEKTGKDVRPSCAQPAHKSF